MIFRRSAAALLLAILAMVVPLWAAPGTWCSASGTWLAPGESCGHVHEDGCEGEDGETPGEEAPHCLLRAAEAAAEAPPRADSSPVAIPLARTLPLAAIPSGRKLRAPPPPRPDAPAPPWRVLTHCWQL